jgi:hypothetical protein
VSPSSGPTKSITNVTVNGDRVLEYSRTQESSFLIQTTPKISDPVSLTYVLRGDVNGVDIPLLFMKDISWQTVHTPEKKQISWLHSILSPALAYLFITTDWAVGSQFVLPCQRSFQSGNWRLGADTFMLTVLKNLNNRMIAEVVMKQSLDSKEQLRSYYQALAKKHLQELSSNNQKLFGEKNKKTMESTLQQIEKNYETTIENFLKKNHYQYLKCTWHIDLVSGLVLRYEAYRKNLDPNGCSEFDLFQMLES